ncbi:MAG: Hint domain-containing protein [Pseudomonadota bacterium]
MGNGRAGAHIISIEQTVVDGIPGAPPNLVAAGSQWRWHGEPTLLGADWTTLSLGHAALSRAQIGAQRRVAGATVLPSDDLEEAVDTIVVTDGSRLYVVQVVAGRRETLYAFGDAVPAPERDHWVVSANVSATHKAARARAEALLCFVSGTLIATPDGQRAVEDIGIGDQVLTRDNGAQPVAWTGQRAIGGARLYAMPEMRPLMIRADAFGTGEPDADLFVSPDHRMLLQGAVSQAIFGTDEVLVAARDLRDDLRVRVDHWRKSVTYHHLMFEAHQIVWANGLPSETFHPMDTDLDRLDDAGRLSLIATAPDIYRTPSDFGGYARRALDRAEAAILLHGQR